MLIMNATINTILRLTGNLAEKNLAGAGQGMILGIQTLETGVFGGMLIGITAYLLHERFFMTKLPDFLGFFGGSRFVPIICAIASIF